MTDRSKRDNRNKPNRGQDTNQHTYVHPVTGVTRTGTQRQYREGRWAAEGFINQDEVDLPAVVIDDSDAGPGSTSGARNVEGFTTGDSTGDIVDVVEEKSDTIPPGEEGADES